MINYRFIEDRGTLYLLTSVWNRNSFFMLIYEVLNLHLITHVAHRWFFPLSCFSLLSNSLATYWDVECCADFN